MQMKTNIVHNAWVDAFLVFTVIIWTRVEIDSFIFFLEAKIKWKILHHNTWTILRNIGMQINLWQPKLSRPVFTSFRLYYVYVSSGLSWPGAEDCGRTTGRFYYYYYSYSPSITLKLKQVQKVKWMASMSKKPIAKVEKICSIDCCTKILSYIARI